MRFFFAPCALHLMQNFVTLIDSWSGLLFAGKVHSVVNVADDASVLKMELGREIELGRHAAETPSCARSSTDPVRPRRPAEVPIRSRNARRNRPNLSPPRACRRLKA